MAPPDLQSYMQQAAQLGFKPKMYIIDKGTGYPEPMRALGDYGIDILSVNFWSPAFPGKSKYGNYDGQGLVNTYQSANPGKLYSPPLALGDASYDVLFDSLQRAGTTDKDALLKAIGKTDLETVVGRIKFNDQHYSVMPLGGAQWSRDKQYSRQGKCLQLRIPRRENNGADAPLPTITCKPKMVPASHAGTNRVAIYLRTSNEFTGMAAHFRNFQTRADLDKAYDVERSVPNLRFTRASG